MKKKRKYTKRPGVSYGRPKGWKAPVKSNAEVVVCTPDEVRAICGGKVA